MLIQPKCTQGQPIFWLCLVCSSFSVWHIWEGQGWLLGGVHYIDAKVRTWVQGSRYKRLIFVNILCIFFCTLKCLQSKTDTYAHIQMLVKLYLYAIIYIYIWCIGFLRCVYLVCLLMHGKWYSLSSKCKVIHMMKCTPLRNLFWSMT